MNVQRMIDWVNTGNWPELENAWIDVLAEGPSAADLAKVLEAVTAKGKADLSATLAEILIDGLAALPPADALALAKALLLAVPSSSDLRKKVCELYKQVHAG